MLRPLRIGDEYTKAEIEALFNTNFGYNIKGINLRRSADGTPYIILFSKANGPYSDNFEGDFFYYDGEGMSGDQRETRANRALMLANITRRPIYGFRQETPNGKWEYVGLLEVVDYAYIAKNSRMVYEFKMRKTFLTTHRDVEIYIGRKQVPEECLPFGMPDNKPTGDSAGRIFTSTGTVHDQMPAMVADATRQEYLVKRKARNALFRSGVKQIYRETCAVCKKRRVTIVGYPEVEAAHIKPVERNGPDDLRNGLALCKLHHWAFDAGLFSLADDRTVLIKDRDVKSWNEQDATTNRKNYEEIRQYQGQRVDEPEPPGYAPLREFLHEHRQLHGFT